MPTRCAATASSGGVPSYNRQLPELRNDPITGRWVIIATDRAKRPSDFIRQPVPPAKPGVCPFDYGQRAQTPPEMLAYRNSGDRDEPGWRVRVVPNKFPALGIEGELNRQGDGMYDKMNGIGAHEVIIETPDHNATLGEMPERQIEELLWALRERVERSEEGPALPLHRAVPQSRRSGGRFGWSIRTRS